MVYPIASKNRQLLNYWAKNSGLSGGNVQICIQRSSETYESMAPLTINAGACPTGYTKCGSSPENVFCTKQAKCPINSITVAPAASTATKAMIDEVFKSWIHFKNLSREASKQYTVHRTKFYERISFRLV